MMRAHRLLRIRRFYTVTALILAMLSSPVTAQTPRADAAVEDIVILRSLRLSRITPTDFCAPSRTGFSEAIAEDRYDFKAVATDAASGKVTNVSGARLRETTRSHAQPGSREVPPAAYHCPPSLSPLAHPISGFEL
jgi:hypothetical protein